MLKKLKEFLEKILPPPIKTFNREVARILTSIEWVNEKTDKLQAQNEVTQNAVNRLVNKMEQGMDSVSHSLTESMLRIEKAQEDIQSRYEERLNEAAEANSDNFAKIADIQNDLLDSIKALREQNEQLKTELEAQKAAAAGQNERIREAIASLCDGQSTQMGLISSMQSSSETMLAEQANSFDAMLTRIQDDKNSSSRMIAAMQSQLRQAERKSAEAVWAQVFNNAVSGCDWLYGRPLSPGRDSAGYPFLFAMFHALNQAKPKSILELGLGQSTVMLSRYATTHPGTMHFVVEPDYDWINFFQNEYALSYPTRILQMPTEFVSYKDAEKVRVFKNFDKGFAGQRFDFIIIDAPLGGDMPEYSRIDVLRMMPNCLNDDFVIIIDDTERDGEKRTVAEMEECLKNANIQYKKGRYSGEKDCTLLTSWNWRYLTTL